MWFILFPYRLLAPILRCASRGGFCQKAGGQHRTSPPIDAARSQGPAGAVVQGSGDLTQAGYGESVCIQV